jgi:U32 family peptidase
MKPELLSPAGDWPSLIAAVKAGADAVYFGAKQLNMRAAAKNFDIKEVKKAVNYCHNNGVKAYLTLNTIIYENELKTVRKILTKAKEAWIDAVIAWDLSVIHEANKLNIPVHLSTQASISNSEALNFIKRFGVKRVNLARECSLDDIRKIRKKTDVEIEVFIHGAMCISESGRCFLSQELFRKSANRGECLQPCRRSYIIKDIEEKHELVVGSNYILSPKDLCTLPFIQKLIGLGVNAFKIEGRNRSPEYVKAVTEAYREAIDTKLTKERIKQLMDKLKTVYNRGFNSGFYLGKPSTESFTDAYGSKATERKEYIGRIMNYYKQAGVAEVKIESGRLKVGDRILIIGNTTGVIEQQLLSIKLKGKDAEKAVKGQLMTIKTDSLARINDKVFLVRKSDGLLQGMTTEKKVLVFGTFDLLHPGHISLFKEAKKLGDYLTVVVARNRTVEELKGRKPKINENERLEHVSELSLVDEAVLGNTNDKYGVLERINPDVICLGYDQESFTYGLEEELKKRGIKAKIVRLKPYKEDRYKSSKLNDS